MRILGFERLAHYFHLHIYISNSILKLTVLMSRKELRKTAVEDGYHIIKIPLIQSAEMEMLAILPLRLKINFLCNKIENLE